MKERKNEACANTHKQRFRFAIQGELKVRRNMRIKMNKWNAKKRRTFLQKENISVYIEYMCTIVHCAHTRDLLSPLTFHSMRSHQIEHVVLFYAEFIYAKEKEKQSWRRKNY